MLADVTSTARRYILPRDFTSVEDKTSTSMPTGTASAVINFGEGWIGIDVTQAWFWTPEWQAGERKVEEYIEAGNFETFNSMEEFLDTLGD